MDVLRREDVHEFGEHVLEEGVHFLIAGAEDVVGNAPAGPDLIGTAGAAQLWISGQGSHHVAGEVDLRDHDNAAFGSIVHDFLHLVLGVEAAVADAVVGVPVHLDDGTVAPGANFSELGIFLDLHSPALVLGKVPVEAVELIGCHHVQVALGFLDGEEVAAGIQVHAAIGEAGLVVDMREGQRPVGLGLFRTINGRRQHLLERFAGIDETV